MFIMVNLNINWLHPVSITVESVWQAENVKYFEMTTTIHFSVWHCFKESQYLLFQ